MTEEIFRRDGYAFEFEACVVSVEGDDVELDITAFYPGGGGQVCDTGTIRGMPVTEVFYKKDRLVHKVPGNDLRVKERVWCSVDWDRRYELMMGHTGEHLLFCALKRQVPDLEITKIHISPESKYVIISKDICWEDIGKAVVFANSAIKDNLPVTKTLMSRDDPELENVRIKMDRIPEGEDISVVSIGDIDLSACSGVHVMETGELEMIIVDRKVSAGKDGIAVHFKVGEQAKLSALELANRCLMAVDAADTKPEDLVKAVDNLKRASETCKSSSDSYFKKYLSEVMPENVKGVDVFGCLLPVVDRNVMTDAAEVNRSKGAVSVFISAGESLSVMMSSGKDSVDCKAILTKVLSEFGGKGGGKKDFAQGGIGDTSIAGKVLQRIKDEIVLCL